MPLPTITNAALIEHINSLFLAGNIEEFYHYVRQCIVANNVEVLQAVITPENVNIKLDTAPYPFNQSFLNVAVEHEAPEISRLLLNIEGVEYDTTEISLALEKYPMFNNDQQEFTEFLNELIANGIFQNMNIPETLQFIFFQDRTESSEYVNLFYQALQSQAIELTIGNLADTVSILLAREDVTFTDTPINEVIQNRGDTLLISAYNQIVQWFAAINITSAEFLAVADNNTEEDDTLEAEARSEHDNSDSDIEMEEGLDTDAYSSVTSEPATDDVMGEIGNSFSEFSF